MGIDWVAIALLRACGITDVPIILNPAGNCFTSTSIKDRAWKYISQRIEYVNS